MMHRLLLPSEKIGTGTELGGCTDRDRAHHSRSSSIIHEIRQRHRNYQNERQCNEWKSLNIHPKPGPIPERSLAWQG